MISARLSSPLALSNIPVPRSGTDDNDSGIVRFDIWVSENYGPFSQWQRSVATTSERFVGTAGSTYRFFSTATDGVGHMESVKSLAEATTTFSLNSWQYPPSVLDANDDNLVSPIDVLLIISHLNLLGAGFSV